MPVNRGICSYMVTSAATMGEPSCVAWMRRREKVTSPQVVNHEHALLRGVTYPFDARALLELKNASTQNTQHGRSALSAAAS
jgi:hypothetical protein